MRSLTAYLILVLLTGSAPMYAIASITFINKTDQVITIKAAYDALQTTLCSDDNLSIPPGQSGVLDRSYAAKIKAYVCFIGVLLITSADKAFAPLEVHESHFHKLFGSATITITSDGKALKAVVTQ